MPSGKKIVVFGSIVQDLISYTESFPRPGESVRGKAFFAGGGGKGANQAVAAATLGGDVTLVARVGDDMFGEQNLKTLKRSGVNVDLVVKSETSSTATATITVDSTGENSIVVVLGANMELDASKADKNEKILDDAFIAMAQAEIGPGGNKRFFQLAKKHGVTTFFNPAPGDRNMDKSILEFVDIICTNENETEFITGEPMSNVEEARRASALMLEKGPQHAIITLGADGCVLASRTSDGTVKVDHFKVPKVQAIDTTGAGDCFCGSFAYLLASGSSVADATRKAAGIAALSVQRKGTQASYWSREEIKEKHSDLLD